MLGPTYNHSSPPSLVSHLLLLPNSAISVDDWNHNQAGTYIHFALSTTKFMLFVIFGVVFLLSNIALLRFDCWNCGFLLILVL